MTSPPDLALARAGDAEAFGRLTEPHRRELLVHCYRMLGAMAEAEDAVQETFLRAWRRLATYAERASFRAWLYRIATNYCLDALDRRVRRTRPMTHSAPADPAAPFAPPTTEPLWLEPCPDEWLVDPAPDPEARWARREAVSLAFLAALHQLPPRPRAVLILSEVLDWPAREIAAALAMTVSAVNSALHRARTALAPGPALTPRAADARLAGLLARYVRAWEADDVEALVALLAEDASFAMPPSPSWYAGRTAIGQFLRATLLPGDGAARWQLRAAGANGQPAYGLYRWQGAGWVGIALQVLTPAPEGDRLAALESFMRPDLLGRFGLPAGWPSEG